MKDIKEIFIGCLNFILYLLNLIMIMIPLTLVSIVKFTIPVQNVRKIANIVLNQLATFWISVNNEIITLTTKTKWFVEDFDKFSMDEWYLVLANHQSWVDILVLQKIFNKQVPFLKFFIKKQLLYVPLLGYAWWALDFPTMRRHKREEIEKNPSLRGKDLEDTKKACEKFKTIPISIMNFVEGTRFTKAKHKKQKSQYNNLLKPKAGGISFVLSAMGGQLHKIIDVTICYPSKTVSFWDYLAGKIDCIKVKTKVIDITPDLIGDYFNDNEYKAKFQNWLNNMWEDKDKLLDELKAETN